MDAVSDYIKSSEKPEPLPPGDLNVFIFFNFNIYLIIFLYDFIYVGYPKRDTFPL